MKTVVHTDSSKVSKQSEVLGNVKNLLEDDETQVDKIVIVVNGDAVEMVRKGSQAEEFLKEFIEEGVKVKVCSNSIDNRDLGLEDLINGVEKVSSGIGELTRLQDQDYAYIRP